MNEPNLDSPTFYHYFLLAAQIGPFFYNLIRPTPVLDAHLFLRTVQAQLLQHFLGWMPQTPH